MQHKIWDDKEDNFSYVCGATEGKENSHTFVLAQIRIVLYDTTRQVNSHAFVSVQGNLISPTLVPAQNMGRQKENKFSYICASRK